MTIDEAIKQLEYGIEQMTILAVEDFTEWRYIEEVKKLLNDMDGDNNA